MTYTNSNKSILFLTVLFGVLCSSYTIVNNSSSTNTNIDLEIQVLDELIIDSISDNSNDSLLVKEDEEITDEESPILFVNNQPHFEQCAHLETNLERHQCTMALINKKIGENFNIPKSELRKTTNGIIQIQFVVSKTGEITNVKILKGINKKLDNEAKRVVRSLPKMIPGKTDLNKNVSILYHLPIRINIQ
jgi:protein TonB